MAGAPSSIRCVIVTGPTATGKTGLAVELCRRFNGEVISADSRQIYRGMDIGTGKDLEDYQEIPCHLIDICDPNEDYHLFQYLDDCRKALQSVSGAGNLPVIAGGTALYINALVDDYSLEGTAPNPQLRERLGVLSDKELLGELASSAPDIYARTDKTQRKRILRAVEIAKTRNKAVGMKKTPDLDFLILAPLYPRKTVHKRIEARLDARLLEGMIEEVKHLHKQGVSWDRLDFFGLEYRYAAQHLQGHLSLQEFHDNLLVKIRQFCKRQDIWFRKMEREGKRIHWIKEGDIEKASALVLAFLNGDDIPEPEFRLMDHLNGPQTN